MKMCAAIIETAGLGSEVLTEYHRKIGILPLATKIIGLEINLFSCLVTEIHRNF
jgi:hypothetical protein